MSKQARLPTVVQETLDVFGANLSGRDIWDEPAELYWLTLTAGRIRLELFSELPGFFEDARPVEKLAALAEAAEQTGPRFSRLVPPGMYGLAFFTEAWTVDVSNLGPDEVDEVMRHAHARKLSSRTDRIEQRSIHGVDRNGYRLYVAQPRGGPIKTIVEQRTSESRLTGTVVLALEKLLTVVKG
ncbi:hypothetical protein [Mycobacteroides abscessus]|uniref:Uncharacterized protein n=1 Tax=Mycobacteroides abscessus subsp. massiliense TaxID=1962118 RepID=A0A4D8RXP3_9MYCO|nr:hypothetical protein [Mycobacteroides abscessus]QCO28930.1 hypothetical protein CFE69_23575 [Mycobacteroides abscessus subsp. massiliense]SHY28400.1 Uncharacterised protein [Mycobacteroides abscessus subsp. abscessus]SID71684.1 Uncharacterised protein [Mycobacteroides abscessus subsp. abscessus]SIK18902.1 Uncharacterised protein [Mycobacteroides abscessus subsp. abscessus]SIM43304.1 Uncharacterised protein [Mycobacteroides abscessus subsp. abscessus]